MEETFGSIAAAPGLRAVTPVALLRLKNVYSPGTTIGVSSFIAYAMTRGRVRLIARSNGSARSSTSSVSKGHSGVRNVPRVRPEDWSFGMSPCAGHAACLPASHGDAVCS